MQSFSRTSQSSTSQSSTSQSSQPLTPAATQANLNTAMGCIVLVLPIVLLLSITAHRKHRAAVMRRQIQQLEKLWLLSSSETIP